MWPFKRKDAPKPGLSKLIYKNGEAFFDMQCKYGFTEIKRGQGISSLVIDATKEFGTEQAVKIQPNGCQLATIKVASDDGGFVVLAETASKNGDRLQPGDVVIWVPMTHMKDLARKLGNDRQGWVGLIVAKVAPESDPNTNEMTVICEY
jgi:hypothetical protein